MTFEQLCGIWAAWQQSDKQLRFGQYAMNVFFPTEVNPAIYYEIDDLKAFDYFLDICTPSE